MIVLNLNNFVYNFKITYFNSFTLLSDRNFYPICSKINKKNCGKINM